MALTRSALAMTSAAALWLSACASDPNEVSATYVSPTVYQSHSCDQIGEEMRRINAEVSRLTGVQEDKATGDAVATTVGVVLFWPALFFIDGDDEQTYELSRLKGEHDALRQAAITKDCSDLNEALAEAEAESSKEDGVS